MNRTRRILVVTFVATALFADRFGAAAPLIRPQMAQTVRQIAGRLVISFRRVVPSVRFNPLRREERLASATPVRLADTAQLVHPIEFSPFQFRLPPPVL
jgi:hypothetical protein